MLINVVVLVALVLLNTSPSEAYSTFNPCSYKDVRITGKPYAGILEACWGSSSTRNRWFHVCGNSWSNATAGVVCRHLNFTNPLYQEHEALATWSKYYSPTQRFLKIECVGNFSHLKDCNFIPTNCPHHIYGEVVCDIGSIAQCSSTTNGSMYIVPANLKPSSQHVTATSQTSSPELAITVTKTMTITLVTQCSIVSHNSSMKVADKSTCETSNAAVGTVAVLLAVILAIVIIGWLWSCYKRWSKVKKNMKNLHDHSSAYDGDSGSTIDAGNEIAPTNEGSEFNIYAEGPQRVTS